MNRSALSCLPPALLAAFIGVIATPHPARASAAGSRFQSDEISLRRPDASQFMDGSRGAPAGLDPGMRSAAVTASIRIGPGCVEPTTIVETSDPEFDRALATTLSTVFYVASAILVFKLILGMGDALHSETPVARGTDR